MTDVLRSADGRDLDRISLIGLSATGHHGVLPAERRDGQTFRVDVVLHVDTRPAAATDALALTVDYGVLATRVEAVITGEPVDLIETLAQRIADVALEMGGVQVVDVVVHKPQAPITVPFDDVQLAIRRHAHARVPAASSSASSDLALPAEHVVREIIRPDDLPNHVFGGRGGVDPLERRPGSPVGVVLALGGNVGDTRATLWAAIDDLRTHPGIRLTGVSPLARTAAVGPEQADYLNIVVTATTTLAPRELHAVTGQVEDAHGRVREVRWGPRTLDIDLISVDGVLSADPGLELPHPRAHERAFVLVPWAELDPGAVLPGPHGGPVADLAQAAPDRDGIRWLALDWLDDSPDVLGSGEGQDAAPSAGPSL